MFKTTNLLILGALLLMSACSATPQPTDDQQCRAFGAMPGTDAYVDCMSNLAVRDATRGYGN